MTPRITRHRPLLAAMVPLATAALLALLAVLAPRAAAQATTVTVFPTPSDRLATPQTQITIRGIPTSAFGTITVTGSKTGTHTGTVEADSDGDGGSFIPDKPFQPGETVTVATGLDVAGATNGTWQFTIATPALITQRKLKPEAGAKGSTWHYSTDRSIHPPAITVTTNRKGTAPGYLFFGPQLGPIQNGAEITNSAGKLVYFNPVPRGQYAMDVQTQTYDGEPALTYWKGTITTSGTGTGEDEIYSDSYQHLATVRAGNGLSADLHEFLIDGDDAWITAYQPVVWNATAVKHGWRRQAVLNGVVQEIDLKTGLVLFQWNSLDHVPLGASYLPVEKPPLPWDYFHVNAIQPLSDGTVLISARNTSAVYDVDGTSGRIHWVLGGKFSSFKLGKGARFWYQHDARLQANGQLTMFDDGGMPFREPESRGLTLNLNAAAHTATVASQQSYDSLKAAAEGSDQLLGNGDTLLGWGQGHDLATEFSPKGSVLYNARFVGPNASYRVFRQSWSATPATKPAVLARVVDGQVTVSASWNGANTVHSWRILGGGSRGKLSWIGIDRDRDFQTNMPTHRSPRYVEVQAVDASHKTLASSAVVKVSGG
ncbi:MAG TPA: arylsulfotransferase family protein [Solirubrobacteraceae bacterium]|nr:arylsulfotransferase family protein [Solirubrobacteraceae bacterium]